MRRKMLGHQHRDTLASTADLAALYLSQGKWNGAEQLTSSVLSLMKQELDVDDVVTLSTMAKFGRCYQRTRSI